MRLLPPTGNTVPHGVTSFRPELQRHLQPESAAGAHDDHGDRAGVGGYDAAGGFGGGIDFPSLQLNEGDTIRVNTSAGAGDPTILVVLGGGAAVGGAADQAGGGIGGGGRPKRRGAGAVHSMRHG